MVGEYGSKTNILTVLVPDSPSSLNKVLSLILQILIDISPARVAQW